MSKMDQTDPTVFDSIARGSAVPLVPIPSSVSKDSELPNTVEADPKRRRRIGKVGTKKEPREDCGGTSDRKSEKSQVATRSPNYLLDTRDCSIVRKCGVTDMVLLYITLVTDRAIPAGFLAEFLSLEHSLRLSSRRFMNQATSLTDACGG